jgi:hypothetical protein
LEESGRGLVQVLSQHLPGGTKDTTKNRSKGSQCSSKDSNQASPEYKPTALRLHQPHRCVSFVTEFSECDLERSNANHEGIVQDMEMYSINYSQLLFNIKILTRETRVKFPFPIYLIHI